MVRAPQPLISYTVLESVLMSNEILAIGDARLRRGGSRWPRLRFQLSDRDFELECHSSAVSRMSNVHMNTLVSWRRYLIRSNSAMPSSPHATASPSMM